MLVLTVLTHACERALETRRLESRENAMDVLSSCHMLFQPHMMSNQRKLFGPFSRSAPLIKCLASQGRCCNAADEGQSFATAKADPPDSNAVIVIDCWPSCFFMLVAEYHHQTAPPIPSAMSFTSSFACNRFPSHVCMLRRYVPLCASALRAVKYPSCNY